MKILFFSQFYAPESIAPSFRSTENSRLWIKQGHEVTVYTGYPNYPIGRIFDGYDARLLTEEVIEGVRVIRGKLVAKPNTSMIKRLENALGYFFFGLVNIYFQKRKIGTDYDVVLGTSGIIFNALLAWIYAARIRVPFVFEIRDITYVQMQATGKGRNSVAVKGMRWLELWLCRKAANVVVVTHGFKKLLMADGVEAEKINVITNGVDVEKSENVYCVEKKFILSYYGTLGLSQNIRDTFAHAAAIADVISDFEYLIIGDGAQRDEIEEAARGIDFIKILPGMSLSELEPYYNDTQLSVIALRKSENFKYTIPSKLFQVMGRGIAVLFIGPDGESSDIIRRYRAGIALTGTVEEDEAVIRQFFNRPDWKEKLHEMGNNGRAAVEENFSRTKLAEDFLSVLNSARDVK